MSAEIMKVGQYLKSKREEQKVALEAVARVTRITLTYLQYLERDELHRHVAEIFLHGYLRSYAKFLRLDPDEILSMHQSSMASETGPAPAPKKKAAFNSFSKHMLNNVVDFFWTVLGAAPSFSLGKTVLPPKH